MIQCRLSTFHEHKNEGITKRYGGVRCAISTSVHLFSLAKYYTGQPRIPRKKKSNPSSTGFNSEKLNLQRKQGMLHEINEEYITGIQCGRYIAHVQVVNVHE